MSTNVNDSKAESLFNEGLEFYEQNKYDEAEVKFKEALKFLPNSEDILYIFTKLAG